MIPSLPQQKNGKHRLTYWNRLLWKPMVEGMSVQPG